MRVDRSVFLIGGLAMSGVIQQTLLLLGALPVVDGVSTGSMALVFGWFGTITLWWFLELVSGHSKLQPFEKMPAWSSIALFALALAFNVVVYRAAQWHVTELVRDLQALAILATCIRIIQWNCLDLDLWPAYKPN